MNSSLNGASPSGALKPLTQETLGEGEAEGYLPALELVFSQPGIRHVALAGPANADKAAVAGSWKARRRPDTWLTVSVPRFNGDEARVTSGDAEDALVNQIVCQMDLRRSPKTRFRNLMKRDYALDAVVGAVAAAFVGLTIFLVWAAGLLPSSRPAPALCATALAAWFACIGFGVFRIVRTGAVGRLLGLIGRKGGDVELACGPNDSRIERYMGDLVYLLNTNRFDNVVFEGLDTYRRLPLFERLRALGELANEQRAAGREPLRFFYLVGDGSFDDPHERARFFDYIVPVLPHNDPADVLVQLAGGLPAEGGELDADFLSGLSQHVDDPNILRDIVNEAHHYRFELGEGANGAGDMERLVALLAYKALFPRDFELLQGGQGYLNALLKSRSAIIAETRGRNARAASQLADELSAAEADGDKGRIAEAAAALAALERADVECSRKPLSALLGEMDDPASVFERPPSGEPLDEAHLKGMLASPYFPFIRFAVGGGWIDGTYERFMSDSYAEGLSADDRELASAIAQGLSVRAERPVDNPFAVMSRLDADAFALPSARVFALFSHLLAYGPNDKLESLLRGVGQDDDLGWLLAFTESRYFDGAVFSAMERALEQPVERILADEDIDATRRRRFCHRLLAFGRDALEDAGVRDAAREFAHGDPAFLHVECTEPLSVAEALETIGYRPGELDCTGCDQGLLQHVYAHDLYDPSARAIDALLAGLLDAQGALPAGFLATRVYALSGTAVKEVVEDNADRFVSTLVEDSPVKLADSPEAVAWVLNLEGLSPQHALGYLKALSDDVRIDWLATVENYTYQGVLLDRGLVTVTPANILDYYTSAGNVVDEHLAALLAANPFPADFTMATTEEHLGSESGFLKAVIECEALDDEKVGEITTAYRAQFNHFDMEGLPESRMQMLVGSGVVRATADNLRFVRRSCPGAAKCFAQADAPAYLELVLPGQDGEGGECGFVRNEALEVFSLPDVSDQAKVALLAGFSEPVALSADYPDELNAAIAASNFSEDDLTRLDGLYARGNRKLKRALAEVAAAHREELGQAGILLPMEMTADVAWRLRDDRAEMVGFIATQLAGRPDEPSRLEVRTVFEKANLREYVALMAGPTSVIPDTPEDDALLAALGAMGMAGKQVGKTDWQGLRRVNSKGYSRK